MVFGRLGDRVGRRQVLVTVIVLMAAATAGIGLLPGHAAIGVLAPVLLVVFRAIQGLSVGGEAAGATAFVVEYAPEGRRGWYGSWLWSTLAIGVAGGIGVAVLLALVFPREVLEDRGWRLAFLVALPLGLVGLYLRLRLDETPRFRAVERADAVVRRTVAVTLRAYPGRLLLGLAPVAAATALGVPLSRTLAAALVGLVVVAALALSYGLGTALFGGTAPFLATVLVRRTGSAVAPAVYATVVAAAAVAAAVAARETAFQPLDTADLPEAGPARALALHPFRAMRPGPGKGSMDP